MGYLYFYYIGENQMTEDKSMEEADTVIDEVCYYG